MDNVFSFYRYSALVFFAGFAEEEEES